MIEVVLKSDFTTPQIRILVADDEQNTRLALVRGLQLMGYETEAAANGREVMERLSISRYDLLLLDLRMPEVSGVQVMENIRQNQLDVVVIVLTAYATLESAINAVKAGAADYLIKPQPLKEIGLAIEHALKSRLTHHNRQNLIGVLQHTIDILQVNDGSVEVVNASVSNPDLENPTYSFDVEQRRVIFKAANKFERVVFLTADQAIIFDYMIHHPARILSSREIAQMALGYQNLSEKEADGIIRPHILRMRKKLEIGSDQPKLIRTIRGSGYLLATSPTKP
jgi:DNA-binding response OmpR family regulator